MNVDFKPMKKMKKRRELDALVNGKLGRKTKGQHELLRADSESSDIEEFSIPDQAVVRKRHSSRICATCLMGCGMFLLLACLVAVAGLIWVHIELKRDVDLLHMSLQRLESGSQSNPEEFQSIHTKQSELEIALNSIKTGDKGLTQLQKSVDNVLLRISKLNKTTGNLVKSLAAAPQLETLPATVNTLSKSVADLESNMKSLDGNMKSLTENKVAVSADIAQLKAKVDAIMSQSTPSPVEGDQQNRDLSNPSTTGVSSTMTKYFENEIARLGTSMISLNSTFTSHVKDVKNTGMEHSLAIEKLKNTSIVLESRLSLIEIRPSGIQPNFTAHVMQSIVEQSVNSVMEELKNFTVDNGKEAMAGVEVRLQDMGGRLQMLESNSGSSGAAITEVNITEIVNLEQQLNKHQSEMGEEINAVKDQVSTISDTLGKLIPRVNAVENRGKQPGISPIATPDAGDSDSDVSAGDIPDDIKPKEEAKDATSIVVTDKDDEGEDGGDEDAKGPVEGSTTIQQDEDEPDEEDAEITRTSPKVLITTQASTTKPPKPLLSLPWVHSQEDMRDNFYRWDMNGDGFVLYDDLPGYLGPNLFDKTILQQYDSNLDRKYTLNEMMAAFGYPPYKETFDHPDDDLDLEGNAGETEGEGEDEAALSKSEDVVAKDKGPPMSKKRSVLEENEELPDFLSNLVNSQP